MRRALSIMALAMLPAFAMAQTAPVACGVGGTAKIASGELVTRSAASAAGLQIKEDGYWWTCLPPAYVPPVQPPKPCVPQNQGFRTWTVGEHSCTTYRKYASSATDPARDRVIDHNRIGIWNQWTGSMRGQLIERCTDGVRTVAGATCAPVTHCDSKWSTSADGGKTVYVYDARSTPNRVPVGAYAQAVADDGKTLRIQCVAGDFKAAPEPLKKRK